MATKWLILGIFFILEVLPVLTSTRNDTTDDMLPVYRISTVLSHPWMMKTPDGYAGFLVDLLQEVSFLANFSYSIQTTPDLHYGEIKYTGEGVVVTGIIGDIVYGQADLGVADLTISDERSIMVTFSSPFATTGAHILLKKPEKIGRGVFLLLAPFSPTLWLCTAVALLFTTAVLYWTQRLGPGEARDATRDRMSLVGCFQFVLTAFLLRGGRDLPASVPSRIIVVCWWLFTVVIVISYASCLTGYLLTSSTSKATIPFKSFDELAAQSDTEYGGWFGMILNLNDNVQRKMNRHINSRYTHYSNLTEAISRSLDNDFAAIVNGFDGDRIVNENCDLMLLREQLFEINYGIACALGVAGEALCSNISMSVRTLREDGTLYAIMTKWWKISSKCDMVSENDFITAGRSSSAQFRELDFSDVSIAFIVLLIGAVASGMVTLVEAKSMKKKSVDKVKTTNSDSGADDQDHHRPVKATDSVPLELTRVDEHRSSLKHDEEYPDIDAP